MEFLTLNKELAHRAHSGTSFDPEKRAASHIKCFNESLAEDWETFSKLAVSEQQKEVLKSEFERYQANYKAKYENWLSAKSRCLSSMITGPANFPARRNEKANISERKRGEELADWCKKAEKAVINKINAARTPEQLQADANEKENQVIEYLLKEATHSIACVGGKTPYSPALIKGALERKIMNFAKNNPDAAERTTKEINLMCQEQFNKDVFTSKHKIWKAIEAIKEEKLNPPMSEDNKELFKNDFVTVINNHEAQRIQLIFEDKPEVEVRDVLKSHAFRWSPRFGAWQRQNTNNGIYNTKLVLKKLYSKEV